MIVNFAFQTNSYEARQPAPCKKLDHAQDLKWFFAPLYINQT